jgi:lipopolysaccharide transport system ATP-binding protein
MPSNTKNDSLLPQAVGFGVRANAENIAIRISNLNKRYEIYISARDRLKQFVLPRLHRLIGRPPRQFFHEFSALNDVSFEVKKGETVGIIGRNGSGKSTLLQILCGTLTPTGGSVEISGRVAALLELGAGFNSEFTGRENVYMNAGILGLSREEIDARFDDIIAFADIGEFIEQPVKTYSSGMYVRLAFSVIAHVDADILIIDEAMAVGDVFFQQKCMRYLREFQGSGGTVVFVSHDTSAVVSLCNRAILLSHNADAVIGETDEICKLYIKNLYAERSAVIVTEQNGMIEQPTIQSSNAKVRDLFVSGEQPENLIHITPFHHDAGSFGQGGARIVDAWFEDNAGSKTAHVHGGELVNFCIKVESFQNIQWPAFGFMLKDRLGQYIIAEGTDLAFKQHAITLKAGDVIKATFSFVMPILFQGEYSFNVAFAEGVGDDHIQHHWINDAMILQSIKSRLVHGICGLQSMSMKIHITAGNKD